MRTKKGKKSFNQTMETKLPKLATSMLSSHQDTLSQNSSESSSSSSSSSLASMTLQEKILKLKISPRPSSKMSHKQRQKVMQQFQKIKMNPTFNDSENSELDTPLHLKLSRGMFYDIPEPNLKDSNSITRETSQVHDVSSLPIENSSICSDRIEKISTKEKNGTDLKTESDFLLLNPEKTESKSEIHPNFNAIPSSNIEHFAFELKQNHVDSSDVRDQAFQPSQNATPTTEPDFNLETLSKERGTDGLTLSFVSNEAEEYYSIHEVLARDSSFHTVNESGKVKEPQMGNLSEEMTTMNNLEPKISSTSMNENASGPSTSTLDIQQSTLVCSETCESNHCTSLNSPFHETELHSSNEVPSTPSDIDCIQPKMIESNSMSLEREISLPFDTAVLGSDFQPNGIEKKDLDLNEPLTLATSSDIPIIPIEIDSKTMTSSLPNVPHLSSTLESVQDNSKPQVTSDAEKNSTIALKPLFNECDSMDPNEKLSKKNSFNSLTTTLETAKDVHRSDLIDSKDLIEKLDLNSTHIDSLPVSSNLTLMNSMDIENTPYLESLSVTSNFDTLDSISMFHEQKETDKSGAAVDLPPSLSDCSKEDRVGAENRFFALKSMEEPSISKQEKLDLDFKDSSSSHDFTTSLKDINEKKNRENIDFESTKDISVESLLSINMISNIKDVIEEGTSSSLNSFQELKKENEILSELLSIPFSDPKKIELSLDTDSPTMPSQDVFRSDASFNPLIDAHLQVDEKNTKTNPLPESSLASDILLPERTEEMNEVIIQRCLNKYQMEDTNSNETEFSPLYSQILDDEIFMNKKEEMTFDLMLKEEDDSTTDTYPVSSLTDITASSNEERLILPSSDSLTWKETIKTTSTSQVQMEASKNFAYVLQEEITVSSTTFCTHLLENLKIEKMEEEGSNEMEPCVQRTLPENQNDSTDSLNSSELDSKRRSLDLYIDDFSVQMDPSLSENIKDERSISINEKINISHSKEENRHHHHHDQDQLEVESDNLLEDELKFSFIYSKMESSPMLSEEFQLEEEIIQIPNPSELASALVANELLDECPSHPFKNNPLVNQSLNEDIAPPFQISENNTFMQDNNVEDAGTKIHPLSLFKESPALEVNVGENSYVVQEGYDSTLNKSDKGDKQEVLPMDSEKSMESLNVKEKASSDFSTSMDTSMASEKIEMNVNPKPKMEALSLSEELSYENKSCTCIEGRPFEASPISLPKSSTAAAAEVETPRSMSISTSDDLSLKNTNESNENLEKEDETEPQTRGHKENDSEPDPGLWKTIASTIHQPGMPPTLEITMHLSFLAFIFALFIISYFTWGTTVSYYSIFLAIVNVGIWILSTTLNSYTHSRSIDLKEKSD